MIVSSSLRHATDQMLFVRLPIGPQVRELVGSAAGDYNVSPRLFVETGALICHIAFHAPYITVCFASLLEIAGALLSGSLR